SIVKRTTSIAGAATVLGRIPKWFGACSSLVPRRLCDADIVQIRPQRTSRRRRREGRAQQVLVWFWPDTSSAGRKGVGPPPVLKQVNGPEQGESARIREESGGKEGGGPPSLLERCRAGVEQRRSGGPAESCDSMLPRHVYTQPKPAHESPYTFVASASRYSFQNVDGIQ
ncbi:hypothetical protein HPB47_023091, partial [Ixodes persulcatus]